MELDYKTQWGSTEKVTIDINSYLNNGCLYIGLVSHEEGYPEPFGDLTVNLDGQVPDYCAYVDLNNMPELEKFIEENRMGEFSGLVKQSGFSQYPLYMFDAEKLRELCPEGMKMYEDSIGVKKTPEVKEKVM